MEQRLDDVLSQLKGGDDQAEVAVAVVPLDGAAAESGRPTLLEGASDLLTLPPEIAGALFLPVLLKASGPHYTLPTEIFADHLPLVNEASPAAAPSPGGAPEATDTIRPGTDKLTSGEIGSVYVRGYGDPSLTRNDLELIAGKFFDLRATIVRDIVIDDTLFVDPPSPTGDDPPGQGLSALSVDYNSYDVRINPGPSEGAAASIELLSPIDVQIVGRVQTSSQPGELNLIQRPAAREFLTRARFGLPAQFTDLLVPSVRLTVAGSVSPRGNPVVRWISYPSPNALFGNLFKRALEQKGIQIRGKVTRGTIPTTAKRIMMRQSRPMAELISLIPPEHRWFAARQLIYGLGQDDQGTFEYRRGAERLKRILESLGVPPERFVVPLSASADVPARGEPLQLLRILQVVYKDLVLWQSFSRMLLEVREPRAQSNELKSSTELPDVSGKRKNLPVILGVSAHTDDGEWVAGFVDAIEYVPMSSAQRAQGIIPGGVGAPAGSPSGCRPIAQAAARLCEKISRVAFVMVVRPASTVQSTDQAMARVLRAIQAPEEQSSEAVAGRSE